VPALENGLRQSRQQRWIAADNFEVLNIVPGTRNLGQCLSDPLSVEECHTLVNAMSWEVRMLCHNTKLDCILEERNLCTTVDGMAGNGTFCT
jgi:hypothetical protein